MYNTLSRQLNYEEWLLYLRKSRQDDPRETVEQVLAKHERQLQDHAEYYYGGRIPEENIYREVGSGESIKDRAEIQKVLARLEDPKIKGVLVIDCSRLSRGDLRDCATIVDSFRYTNTLVATLTDMYDLNNKRDRKHFKDELLRGNDYLEYTKDILTRGREAAVKRGCYLGKVPPYGFNKIKIGKDNTLEINEQQADVVRLVFDLFTREQLTPFRIAQRLNSMGIPAPKGGEWVKDTIRVMVRNEHYIGKVVWNKVKETQVLVNGEITKKKLKQPADVKILAEGIHPPIIDMETWDAAQSILAKNPSNNQFVALKNPFSSMLVCGSCGRAMIIHPYKKAEDRFECRNVNNSKRCYKSVKYSEVYDAVLNVLEYSELPQLELKVKNGDGESLKIQQRILAKLEKQMEEYRQMEEFQYDMLESRQYTQEFFNKRNAKLRANMEKCEKDIASTRATMPERVNYEDQLRDLKIAIAALKNPRTTPEEKNRLLKAVVDKIIFKGQPPVDKSQWYKKGENEFTVTTVMRH